MNTHQYQNPAPKWILILLVLALTGCGVIKSLSEFRAFKKAMESGQIVDYPGKDHPIHTEVYNGHMLVRVQIGDSTYLFALDSGAPTVISKELAQHAGIEKEGSIPASDVGGSTKNSDFCRIPELQTGGVRFRDIGALIVDIEETNEADFAECKGVSGIFGSTLLNLADWKFSLKDREIVLLGNDHDPVAGEINIPVSYAEVGYPVFDIEIADTSRTVIFDMGFNGYFFLPAEVEESAEEVIVSSVLSHGYRKSVFGKSKDTAHKQLLVDQIRINNNTIENVHVDLDPGMNRGLVGTQLLKSFDAYALYRSNEIRLVPVNDPAEYEFLTYGFKWQIDDFSTPRINMLHEHSELYKNGVRPGDRILHWNGTDTRGRLSTERHCYLLNADTIGETKKLKVEKASGETAEFILQPRDVFNLR